MPPGASDQTVIHSPGGAATLAPGARILNNTYVIETLLGRGGMGIVYKARHEKGGYQRAIKMILPELAKDPKYIDLFFAEANKLSQVDADAIVRYYDILTDEAGTLYMLMEFVDGNSLENATQDRILEPNEAVQLLRRLAQGLVAVYDLGIKAHRDISPANILLPGGKVGRAKLIDFGIAKSGEPETLIGDAFAGKYAYASPEQVYNPGQIDQRSDMYSLGLVVAAAAIGKRLDSGTRQKVPDLSEVPALLRPILAQMLQPLPEQRFQTMRALLKEAERLGVNSAPAQAAPAPAGGSLRKYWPWALGAGLTAAAAAAGAIAFLLPKSPSSSDDVRAQMKQVIAGYRCADLSYSVEPDRGVMLSGYVSTAADLNDLNHRVESVHGIASSHFDVRVRAWPFCEAAALLRPLVDKSEMSGATLGLADGPAHLGNPLALDVRAPAFDGYAYVDYFTSDGEVLHLFPNDKDAFNFRPAHNDFVLGQPPDAGMQRCWTLSGSTGEQLVTYIASSEPLFPAPRPARENAKDYLADLTNAVNISGDEIAKTLFFDLKAAGGTHPLNRACPAG
jgi:serine/threonine protein kinase